ncbi:hypothetical protein NIE88_14960 [Sporolactobacillus shoreicorticis]|uniref:ABC transporter permease n=1 Tax=Sporolactobacillus shoreicorticis TaxID=1923877 RepID=A0ABW5S2F5_9BACL|nr:hypothetical protein [Sporolactobacillus shoreicorticis]MCO7127068.1 hypothetical protein [Sporolactobacillus shoreicorticis]
MIQLMWAHWLKAKRTFVRTMRLLLPVVYSSVLFLYFYSRGKSGVTALNEYTTFFLFFTLCALFTLSLLIPLLLSPDREAGNFGNELRIGISRGKLFVSRFFMILMLVTIMIY